MQCEANGKHHTLSDISIRRISSLSYIRLDIRIERDEPEVSIAPHALTQTQLYTREEYVYGTLTRECVRDVHDQERLT